jgi:hypothetical protein
MAGATIKIFLADGTPLGLRALEKSNWTGRGFDFARADWPKVRTRDEAPDAATAAAVMLGRSSNGRAEWKDSAGRSLRQIQEAAAG